MEPPLGDAAWRARRECIVRAPRGLSCCGRRAVAAEAVGPPLPGPPVLLDPSRHVLKLRGTQAALASPSHLLGEHELCILEHPHVLLDAVERQAERLGQLTDGGGTVREQLEDSAARRIREREERAIEGSC